MQDFLEILKYILPSIIVFLTAWFLMKSWVQKEKDFKDADTKSADRKLMLELKKENQKMVMPIRLQAYERTMLLMERISPENLVMRLRRPGISAGEMQGVLLKNIRDEFDHNVSQQLYVGDESWSKVKTAKEEIIQLINTTASTLDDKADGIELCRRILEEMSKKDKHPNLFAIESIKKEIRLLF